MMRNVETICGLHHHHVLTFYWYPWNPQWNDAQTPSVHEPLNWDNNVINPQIFRLIPIFKRLPAPADASTRINIQIPDFRNATRPRCDPVRNPLVWDRKCGGIFDVPWFFGGNDTHRKKKTENLNPPALNKSHLDLILFVQQLDAAGSWSRWPRLPRCTPGLPHTNTQTHTRHCWPVGWKREAGKNEKHKMLIPEKCISTAGSIVWIQRQVIWAYGHWAHLKIDKSLLGLKL